jgi:hypothetical protein
MIIFVFIFLLSITAFSQSFSLEGGANYFLGDLQKEIKISPYAAADFGYELSDYTELYLQGVFSYLKLKRNSDFHGLYQFLGRTGIETPEHLLKPVVIGTGISMATVRGNNATSEADKYFLSDNETEFGWHIRLELSLFRIKNFKFSTRFYYDQIWTKPKNSYLLHGGFSLGWK